MPHWKTVFASVTGSSHIESGLPCQDASLVREISVRGETFLIAVCSDGAGSASHAEIGSRLTCEHFFSIAEFTLSEDVISENFALEDFATWSEVIRIILQEESKKLGVPLRSLACTMLGAILGPSFGLFCQIGDGAMVVNQSGVHKPVFWPQTGEYANMTHFLTDLDYQQHLEVAMLPGDIDSFTAFTDGLERLILNFSDHSVHAPFLTPMFEKIHDHNDHMALSLALNQYLESELICERTNDDKTLILVVPKPEIENGADLC